MPNSVNRRNRRTNPTKLRPTNVVGLDDLLRESLQLPPRLAKQGLIILVKGHPGTGKSTLALQIAVGAAMWGNAISPNVSPDTDVVDSIHDKVYFESCEQNREEIAAIHDRLGIAVDRIRINSLLPKGQIDSARPFESMSRPLQWAHGITTRLAKSNRQRARLIAVDGLNLLPPNEQCTFEIERLIAELKRHAHVGLIAYETLADTSEQIDYLADMIIELRGEEVGEEPKYFLNRLSIMKSRFQYAVLGWHQYKIRGKYDPPASVTVLYKNKLLRETAQLKKYLEPKPGINVFPSMHFMAHKLNWLDTEVIRSAPSIIACDEARSIQARGHGVKPSLYSEGVEIRDKSALAYILGETAAEAKRGKSARDVTEKVLKRGSCTVVLGARRTWKTLLTLDFLRAGSARKSPEHGLLVSLMGNQPTIISQRRNLCNWFCPKRRGKDCPREKCYQNIHLLAFRPGCITSGEFFHYLSKRLKYGIETGEPIRRLVFWDLTQLECRFPLLAQEHLFIPLLIDYLKQQNEAGNSITSVFMGASNMPTSRSASAIADNVVFCWRDRLKERNASEEKKAKVQIRDKGDKELEKREESIAFYVDRMEGSPESGNFYFMEELALSEKSGKQLGSILKVKQDISKYVYANAMREEIWAMQGLPVRSQRPDSSEGATSS